MHIEGARASRGWAGESENTHSLSIDKSKEEMKSSHSEIENLKTSTGNSESKDTQPEEKVVEAYEVALLSNPIESASGSHVENAEHTTEDNRSMHEDGIKPNDSISDSSTISCNGNLLHESQRNLHNHISNSPAEDREFVQKPESPKRERTDKMVRAWKHVAFFFRVFFFHIYMYGINLNNNVIA